MQPTLIGLILVPICLFLWYRPVQLLQVALIASVFDAAASFVIGGNLGLPVATMPGILFLSYILLQYLLGMRYPGEQPVTWTALPLFMLLTYALLSAILLPRVFEGQVLVWPQKPSLLSAEAVPLRPDGSGRNQCIYLVMDVMVTYFGALLLSRRAIPYKSILGTYLLGGYIVIAISFWQLSSRLGGVPYPSDFFYSNPGIASLTQSMGRIPRISGPFSEPAALAAYLCGVVFSSLWLCIKGHTLMAPRVLFVLSVLTTFLSTSTTGIVTVGVGVPLVLFLVTGRGTPEGKRGIIKIIYFLVGFGFSCLVPLLLLLPSISEDISNVWSSTINKGSSESYDARTGTDLDALKAVVDTYGFGVGWGSFRSSSLVPGILANGGVVGFCLVTWFCFRARRLIRVARGSFQVQHAGQIAVDGFSASIVGQVGAYLLSGPMLTSFSFFLQLACLIGAATRIHLDNDNKRFVTTLRAR